MSNKSTGLKTIAYALNLSINTVSRALRDCDDISTATKELVRKKAFELGYQPNSLSQFLKRDDRPLIALITNGFENFYFIIISQKIIQLIADEECDFTIIYTNDGGEDSIKQCISQRVDGIITAIDLDDKALEAARFNNIPISSFATINHAEWMDEVGPDGRQGASIAANYLINFHKMNKLIYVGIDCDKSVERETDFKEAALKSDPNADVAVFRLDDDFSKLTKLISDGYLGVFCFNDTTSYNVLGKLNSLYPNFRRIFPRFHLVGFDAVSVKIPGLIDITSINYDYDEMCQRTFELLKARIKNPKKEKESVILPVTLHQRKYS